MKIQRKLLTDEQKRLSVKALLNIIVINVLCQKNIKKPVRNIAI